MRSRLVVGALAALVVTGLPAPAAGATGTTYTLSAARSASVDVTFTRAVTLDMGRTRVTGAGAYAGYYVQPLGAAPDSGHGEIWVTEFSYPDFQRFPIPLGNQDAILSYPKGTARRLPAGRYRLHVLGDRAAHVRLALTGAGADRRLSPSRPSPFAAVWKDVTPDVAGQRVPGTVTADLPITVKSADSLTFLAWYVVSHATHHTIATSARQCLGTTEHPALCDQGFEPGPVDPSERGYGYKYNEQHVQHPTTLADDALSFTAYSRRNTAFTGNVKAYYEITSTGVMDRVVVAAFSLAY